MSKTLRRPILVAAGIGLVAAGIGLVAAVLGVVAWWPAGPTDSDYFGPNQPTWVRVPTTLGDPVYAGVLVLNARAGEALQLVSLGIERLEGDATVEPMVRILGDDSQTLGGIAASELPNTINLAAYAALPGFRFSHGDGPVELSVRIVGTTPVHGFDGLWLRFIRNGESAVVDDWIPLRASVCTGSTLAQAVERCRPIEAEMHSFGL